MQRWEAVHIGSTRLLQRRNSVRCHGRQHEEGTVHSDGEGTGAAIWKEEAGGSNLPQRQGKPVHQRGFPGRIAGSRTRPELKRNRALLRQREDGELLCHPEEGEDLQNRCVQADPGTGEVDRVPVCLCLLQPGQNHNGQPRRIASGCVQGMGEEEHAAGCLTPARRAASILLRSAPLHSSKWMRLHQTIGFWAFFDCTFLDISILMI